jgi:beta-lactamase regulating signal transducer with metallopeptidase domain
MVDPNLGLQAASGLVSFLLKTTVELLVCLAVVRLAGSARWRFNVWLAMLLAFAAQWGSTCLQIMRAAWPSASAVSSSAALAHAHPDTVRRIAVAQPIAGVLAAIMATLGLVYAVVLVWRTFGVMAARVRLARAMRHARVPGEQMAQAFAYVLGEAQATGVELSHCELRVLPGIASPATLGWRRPVVIVPPVCEMQDERELAAIFWHELKHVQRNDAFWNAVVRLCSAVLWFHPAVHQAAAQLRVQRELACDADVVREHPQARDIYASCLLQFARAAGAGQTAGAAIEMASAPALLTRRVRSILNERPKTSGWSRASRVAVNLSLVAITVAAMPRINVLFAEDAGAFLLQTSVPIEAREEPSSRQHSSRAVAHPRLRGAIESSAVPVANAFLPAIVQHNDALAAEHRAALGVLTESTGMEPSGTMEMRAEVPAGEAPGSAARIGGASLGSIAVDAAEHIGPLMNDHDGDHHMH